MAEYKNFANRICNVTVLEGGSFYILDPDKILIKDHDLLGYIGNEIAYWELGNAPCTFCFRYTIEYRGNPEIPFTGHVHAFERIKSKKQIKRMQELLHKYYQLIENFHKCKICGFSYKIALKKLM